MSETMRGAIFVGNGKVEVREFAKPKPTGSQVLVRVKASGLCGSDMHSYRESAEYWAKAPIIRGHEPAGVIEETGDAVTMVKKGTGSPCTTRRSVGIARLASPASTLTARRSVRAIAWPR